MHILELAFLARRGPVVFEGIFPLQLLRQIASHRRIMVLTAADDVIRRSYFERADKQPMYRRTQTLSDPQAVAERILQMCIMDSQRLRQEGAALQLRVWERTAATTVGQMMEAVGRHFRISKTLGKTTDSEASNVGTDEASH